MIITWRISDRTQVSKAWVYLIRGVNQGVPSNRCLKWLFCVAFFWMIVWWNRPGKADEKGVGEKWRQRNKQPRPAMLFFFLGLFKIPLLCFPIIFWAQIASDRMVHVMHWSWKWSPWQGEACQLQRLIGAFEAGWLPSQPGRRSGGKSFHMLSSESALPFALLALPRDVPSGGDEDPAPAHLGPCSISPDQSQEA